MMALFALVVPLATSFWASSTRVRSRYLASWYAVAAPTTPQPMMMTSYIRYASHCFG